MVNTNLPRSYAIQKKTLKMNSNQLSIQLEIKGYLSKAIYFRTAQQAITYLAKMDESFQQNQTISIKITGDGTSIIVAACTV